MYVHYTIYNIIMFEILEDILGLVIFRCCGILGVIFWGFSFIGFVTSKGIGFVTSKGIGFVALKRLSIEEYIAFYG